MKTVTINGAERQITASDDTPLLFVLRGELGLMTPKFAAAWRSAGAVDAAR
jgi:isoquinoline 1-oxidoreductase subunit alpha